MRRRWEASWWTTALLIALLAVSAWILREYLALAQRLRRRRRR